MAYLSIEKKREAERNYRRNNKERVLAYEARHRLEMKEFKQSLLSSFPCIRCGLQDPDLIDWHHVEPENRKYSIAEWHLSHNAWWEEVLKCVPVCALCHRKIHTNKLCLILPTSPTE